MNIMSACMRQLVSSDNENELESLSKLIPTIGREFEREYVSFVSIKPIVDSLDFSTWYR